ncbi:hypothetical protein HK097_006507 [Rhizophlyctis rosea]|uniref:Uncharacterized protein n=1 Tax=Rhizophlyctis rosea TaxID=64517 RepID=A0AAD5SES8_9FUNG|nr:hypothetical protein HK097_006507 [Rhizophlyctis rosea]
MVTETSEVPSRVWDVRKAERDSSERRRRGMSKVEEHVEECCTIVRKQTKTISYNGHLGGRSTFSLTQQHRIVEGLLSVLHAIMYAMWQTLLEDLLGDHGHLADPIPGVQILSHQRADGTWIRTTDQDVQFRSFDICDFIGLTIRAGQTHELNKKMGVREWMALRGTLYRVKDGRHPGAHVGPRNQIPEPVDFEDVELWGYLADVARLVDFYDDSQLYLVHRIADAMMLNLAGTKSTRSGKVTGRKEGRDAESQPRKGRGGGNESHTILKTELGNDRRPSGRGERERESAMDGDRDRSRKEKRKEKDAKGLGDLEKLLQLVYSQHLGLVEKLVDGLKNETKKEEDRSVSAPIGYPYQQTSAFQYGAPYNPTYRAPSYTSRDGFPSSYSSRDRFGSSYTSGDGFASSYAYPANTQSNAHDDSNPLQTFNLRRSSLAPYHTSPAHPMQTFPQYQNPSEEGSFSNDPILEYGVPVATTNNDDMETDVDPSFSSNPINEFAVPLQTTPTVPYVGRRMLGSGAVLAQSSAAAKDPEKGLDGGVVGCLTSSIGGGGDGGGGRVDGVFEGNGKSVGNDVGGTKVDVGMEFDCGDEENVQERETGGGWKSRLDGLRKSLGFGGFGRVGPLV